LRDTDGQSRCVTAATFRTKSGKRFDHTQYSTKQTKECSTRSNGRQEHEVLFQHRQLQSSSFFDLFLDCKDFLICIDRCIRDHVPILQQTGPHYIAYRAALLIALGDSSINVLVGEVILYFAYKIRS